MLLLVEFNFFLCPHTLEVNAVEDHIYRSKSRALVCCVEKQVMNTKITCVNRKLCVIFARSLLSLYPLVRC